MTTKLKKRIVVVLAIVASAMLMLLAGCQLNETLEDILKRNNLSVQVTYIANGGVFDKSPSLVTKDIYYPAGSKMLNITETTPNLTSGTLTVGRTGYSFVGWYYAELDENGEYVFTEEAVDFSKPLQEEGHIYVYAKWSANVKVQVVLVTDQDIEYENATYKSGDVLTSFNFYGSTGINNPGTSSAPLFGNNLKTHAFCEYYADEECTTLVSWPISKPEESDVNIYAKFIYGNWTVLRESRDVTDNWANFAISTRKFYLNNDIDCDGRTVGSPIATFACEFNGNGHKISNFVVSRTNIPNGTNTALFENVSATANMYDVTFENFKFNLGLRPNSAVNIYMFACNVDDNAKFNNVIIDGVMTINKPSTCNIYNIPESNGEFVLSNWLCGKYATDEEFLAEYTGITFTQNVKLEITT